MAHRRGAENAENMRENELTEKIIGAAIEVHKALGPGLLESAYEECLAHELKLRRIDFERQLALPVVYKGVSLDCGYRLDFLVEKSVVVELKAVETLLHIHEAQMLTYLEARRMVRRTAHQLQRSGPSAWHQAHCA